MDAFFYQTINAQQSQEVFDTYVLLGKELSKEKFLDRIIPMATVHCQDAPRAWLNEMEELWNAKQERSIDQLSPPPEDNNWQIVRLRKPA